LNEFIFKPTKEQTENSNIFRFMKKYKISSLFDLNEKAKADVNWFWDAVNEDIGVVWDKKYSVVSDFSKGKPWSKWFVDGKINIINSTVVKFAEKTPNKIAYYFISEDGVEKIVTYGQLKIHVNKLANALKSLHVQKGDVVAIYMPMIFESIVAMLACANIGAIQTVVFSGYSEQSLKIRLKDCNAKILFVSDGYARKGIPISQKKVLESISDTKIEKLIVIQYKGVDEYEFSDSILDYTNLVRSQPDSYKAESMASEDPLFILYTSGTTGKPKGVIHTHGSFSVYAGYQASYLIDMKENDILLWPADIGWITGQTWNIYGFLEIGATAIIYDGAIDWPNSDRLWTMLEKYKVTIFGISPTAVRMFRKYEKEPRKQFNLDRIRIIPTTGEPIDEKSWMWLYENIGDRKTPIMNLAGGTEIGGAMLSVFPGMKLKPTTVGIPCPGFDLDVVDENQKPVRNKKGLLVIRTPWPTMTRGLLNDSERYIQSYWSKHPDVWLHGDYVLVDEDGLWYMYGRADDVVNVSGHRLSTVEIEQSVLSYTKIVDAAAISIPDSITGDAIVLFVVLRNKNDDHNTKTIQSEIKQHISEKIGRIAKPKYVFTISEMPKTLTGKIMRRLLRAKLLGESLGDVSSIENPHVLDEIKIDT
jgi:acetyl-CoA synthetase